MKKTALFLSLLFLLSLNMYAQEKKHFVTAGYGFVSSNSVVDDYTKILALSLTEEPRADVFSTGVTYISYKYNVADRMMLGAVYAFERKTADLYNVNDVRVGGYEKNYHLLALEYRYNYIEGKNITLYGDAGLGVMMQNEFYTPEGEVQYERSDSWYAGYQLTPLGIKAGNTVGVYAELGFGYKGVFNFGFFLHF